ncbi:hypothetical protein [Enterovirga rhinocerotis]|uniref:Uncharacterized protein n=1 Tax=Enterovirga rhinocerotis TaxID=1339210 RepID=A0A4V3DZ05_9HYPH|nr:hypothetical protein [Enterovirga rhinocerotis]TDR94649.1 hypothetical protein EV668_1937 [Enterovirga rhinocerotis]
MTSFAGLFASEPDPWKPARCSCGDHESEAQHEKAVALAQSRRARRLLIKTTLRNLLRVSARTKTMDAPATFHPIA